MVKSRIDVDLGLSVQTMSLECTPKNGPMLEVNCFTASFFFFASFTCTPDSIELVNWGTRHTGSIVEWRNLITVEKLYWS